MRHCNQHPLLLLVMQAGATMRTTVTLDDALVAHARSLVAIDETSALLREALKALIGRGSARRLAALAGSELPAKEPPAKAPPRRRFA